MGTIETALLSGFEPGAWPETAGPKYRQVSDRIRQAVATGELPVGSRLPPVRELAFQLGITPGTVARAYSVLTDAGVLEAAVGRGTFVAEPEVEVEDEGAPIEIDVIAHNTEGASAHDVNLFSPHLPSVGQARLIRKLLIEIGREPPSGLMHYPSQVAARPTREAVVDWVADLPLGSVKERHVVLTNGGQNAISLIMQAVLQGRRPVVLVEELAYPGFRRAAELMRAEVVPVAMDAQGVIPEALAAAARAHDAQLFCTTPEVHNPTCQYTPEARRVELAKVARQFDLQILEDACYLLRDTQASSYRMIAPDRSWWVTSLSKTLTPALRFGFGIAPDGQEARLRRAAEHGFFGVSTPTTDLVTLLLRHPQLGRIEAEIQRVTMTYLQAAVNILGMYQLGWRPGAPIVWLTLPAGWRAGAFCLAAEEQGVKIRPAEDYACRNARSPHAVRMAINAGIPLEDFEAALLRLRVLLDNPLDRIGV